MKSETTVKERPILFSAPMVRAILDGRKTMTRRVVKPQPQRRQVGSSIAFAMDADDWAWGYKGQPHRCTVSNKRGGPTGYTSECPYGQPGDRLWVREAFLPCNGIGDVHPVEIGSASYVCFRDGSQNFKVGGYFEDNKDPQACKWPRNAKWRPSIHMPRWASRINLEVTGVRVERLQDITEEEAEREGAALCEHFTDAKRGHPLQPHKTAFAWLWNKINGRDSWAANPWVWVVEFKRAPEVLPHGR